MLNNYWWFKLLTNRFKGVEGVTPEDMVNECTTRRQELIGTCTISVFFQLIALVVWVITMANQNNGKYYREPMGTQHEMSKIKGWKILLIKSWLFQVLNWIGWELKRKGKIFWTNLPTNVNAMLGWDENKEKYQWEDY